MERNKSRRKTEKKQGRPPKNIENEEKLLVYLTKQKKNGK